MTWQNFQKNSLSPSPFAVKILNESFESIISKTVQCAHTYLINIWKFPARVWISQNIRFMNRIFPWNKALFRLAHAKITESQKSNSLNSSRLSFLKYEEEENRPSLKGIGLLKKSEESQRKLILKIIKKLSYKNTRRNKVYIRLYIQIIKVVPYQKR